MFKKLRAWLSATETSEASERLFMAEPPVVAKAKVRLWTGRGSATERDILFHLQYGPMTRRQLDDVLDVTTAGLHLRLMIDRGLIRIVRGTWPFVYEAVESPQADVAVDPHVDDSGPTSTRD